jgi:hypothetical protein
LTSAISDAAEAAGNAFGGEISERIERGDESV